jgi:hypothetical protein
VNLLFLSSFVRGPALPRRRDVRLLPLFRTAADQNHNVFAILAEVDAIAWAEVDLVFKDPGTDAPDLREIPLLQTSKSNGYLGCRRRSQAFEPSGEAFVSVFVNVAAKLESLTLTVTHMLPNCVFRRDATLNSQNEHFLLDICTDTRYGILVIRTFRHRGLKRLYQGEPSRVRADQVRRIADVLGHLDGAQRPSDLDLPGYRLHALKGDLKGM